MIDRLLHKSSSKKSKPKQLLSQSTTTTAVQPNVPAIGNQNRSKKKHISKKSAQSTSSATKAKTEKKQKDQQTYKNQSRPSSRTKRKNAAQVPSALPAKSMFGANIKNKQKKPSKAAKHRPVHRNKVLSAQGNKQPHNADSNAQQEEKAAMQQAQHAVPAALDQHADRKLHIFVRDDRIGTKPVLTNGQYTVLQLKEQLSKEILNISPNYFRLSIANLKPLHREHLSLCDYNIQAGATICVHLNGGAPQSASEQPFCVYIQCNNSQIEPFQLEMTTLRETDTVFKIKELIQHLKKIKFDQIRLMKIDASQSEVVMEDYRSLASYGVKHQEVLFVEIKLIEIDYFDQLAQDKLLRVIDIHNIYESAHDNDDASEILRVYHFFMKTTNKMDAEFLGMLQIEKNRKQNTLIYENLLSTMHNKRERLLFHGTTFENVEKIILNGFNRDYNINAKYGKGTYFAKSARYAALYATKDEKSNAWALLVCRCIVGKSGLGKQFMKQSELYDKDNPAQQYDSLVNDLNNPQIYVINRDYHAVPLYVILFRYKDGAKTH